MTERTDSLVAIPGIPVRTTLQEAVWYLNSKGYRPQQIARLIQPPYPKELVRSALYRKRVQLRQAGLLR